MTYRLRVTARAVADADETHAWIAEHGSPDQADRWYQGLFKHMETLNKHPTRCPRAAESDRFPEELRQLLYGKGKRPKGDASQRRPFSDERMRHVSLTRFPRHGSDLRAMPGLGGSPYRE